MGAIWTIFDQSRWILGGVSVLTEQLIIFFKAVNELEDDVPSKRTLLCSWTVRGGEGDIEGVRRGRESHDCRDQKPCDR